MSWSFIQRYGLRVYDADVYVGEPYKYVLESEQRSYLEQNVYLGHNFYHPCYVIIVVESNTKSESFSTSWLLLLYRYILICLEINLKQTYLALPVKITLKPTNQCSLLKSTSQSSTNQADSSPNRD